MIADVDRGQLRRVGAAPLRINFWDIAWSTAGDRIFYATDDPKRYSLLDLTTDRESPFVLPDSVGWLTSARFSPDERDLVTTSYAHARTQLWRVALKDGRWTRLGKPSPPGWGLRVLLWADDGWIYLGRSGEIRRMRADGSASEIYAKLPAAADGSAWEQCQLAHDARRLVCTGIRFASDIWSATDFDPEMHK
jgi:WD40 repeat protein